MSRTVKNRDRKKGPGKVRIIGGRWRGRKLEVPDLPGLRPTPERIRETLFNWLAPEIHAACCLDLFTGSGALALEALSRGARHVDAIDQSQEVIRLLGSSAERLQLGPDALTLINASAPAWLADCQQRYQLLFIDPPFGGRLMQEALEALANNPVIESGGLVYLEWPRAEALPATPENWQLHRETTAGEVHGRLFRVL